MCLCVGAEVFASSWVWPKELQPGNRWLDCWRLHSTIVHVLRAELRLKAFSDGLSLTKPVGILFLFVMKLLEARKGNGLEPGGDRQPSCCC